MASGAMCSGTPPLQVLTLAPLASLQDARGITRRRSGPGSAPENPNYLNSFFCKTGSKLTYTLAGDSSPVTPLGARPRNPN